MREEIVNFISTDETIRRIIEEKAYVYIIACVVLITIAIRNIFEYKKELKIKKIKEDDNRAEKPTKAKLKKRFGIGDIEKVRMKLVRAGNPMKDILNEYSYYKVKITLSILSAVSCYDQNFTWKEDGMNLIIYAFMGYIIIDVYIGMKKRKRHKEIKDVLDSFISITIDGLQMGQTPNEIFQMAMQRIPKNNPLSPELVRLNMKTIKGNMKIGLEEFRQRTDMEEIDNYCFSLLQYEIGGRAVTMLKKQLELLKTLKANKKKMETQSKANLSSMATALLVGALLIIVFIPFIVKLQEIPIVR